MQIDTYLAYCVLALGILNLLRLALFMLSADLYDMRKQFNEQSAPKRKPYRPTVSVVIPAHNEEPCVVRTVRSVLQNTYRRKRVIVVDDGSTDGTYSKLRYFKRKHKARDLIIVRQPNTGKAAAINRALQKHARGTLVMVLDADSALDPDAIARMVEHFRDERVVAAAANVKVMDSARPLSVAQRLEYVISHRMKRALTVLNMEYIIGGVGSTFRRRIVQTCDYYDTDTMTEDIDLTLKIINRQGNKQHRVIFAADVIARTEGVLTFRDLIRQRFRWKFGRLQSFIKNRCLFFSRDAKHTKQLAWAYLPFIVFSELVLLFEPVFVGFVLYVSWMYTGWIGVAVVYTVVTFFYAVNIAADDTERGRTKAKLLALAPFAYVLLVMMLLVDLIALLRSLRRLPRLIRGTGQGAHWQHVKRAG